jgi:hypothetical protein
LTDRESVKGSFGFSGGANFSAKEIGGFRFSRFDLGTMARR